MLFAVTADRLAKLLKSACYVKDIVNYLKCSAHCLSIVCRKGDSLKLIAENNAHYTSGFNKCACFAGLQNIQCINIYFFIFMYASQVMKGVIEEKTNRIIEVLVSSVKPFQFLLGKIIGVAAVGLVQFLIWIVLGGGIILISQAFFMPNIDLEALKNANDLNMFAQGTEINPEQLAIIQNLVKTIDPMFILKFVGAFLFYFIGGYLLYASLFAAIGAAVDNETDSQQFMTPLSIILVVALYIGIAAMKSPESPMVFWSSLIPFTSPVVLLVRIPFGVPAWEIITSMALLVASFLFFTWLSGKIYRVGILMYGKKVTWKELYKWLRYKA